MEHMLLKAVTSSTTDRGLFTAVISSATIDREKDIVSATGMVRALKRWEPTGKMIPLTWQHSTKAEDQIGYVDPRSARAEGDEVVVDGFVDQSTQRGQSAWRLVKSGVLGFSYGYLTLKASPRDGGGRNLDELDVFEVTATPVPIHNDTRVLAWKSAGVNDQREIADQIARDAEAEVMPEVGPAPPEPPPATREPAPDAASQRSKAAALERDSAEQRRQAEEAGLPTVTGGFEPESEPERESDPEVPETDEQWRKAVELERESARQRRRSEEAELPDLPPEPKPEPAPRARRAPDAADQRRKAAQLERETTASERRAERSRIPAVPPGPPPATEVPTERPSAPETEGQWRKAVELEREAAALRRRAEEAGIPELPDEDPGSTPAASSSREALSAQELHRKAVEVEREAVAQRRRAEEAGIPRVPDEPSPAPAPTSPRRVPSTRELRRKAAEVEREQAQQQRASEETAVPDVPSEPQTDPEPEPRRAPTTEELEQRKSLLERERRVEQREAELRRTMEASPPEYKDARSVGPAARTHLRYLIRYYMGKPHPFTACVRDNMKRFGPGRTEAICATLKDIGTGTTHWRRGGRKRGGGKATFAGGTTVGSTSDAPDEATLDDAIKALYDAADGDLEALLEMLLEWMQVNGDVAPEMPMMDLPSNQEQRATAKAVEQEFWLPPGVEEPPETPRQPRADRLAELEQRLEATERELKARLENLPEQPKSAEAASRGNGARLVDPLRKRADATALEHASDGESLRKPPIEQKALPPSELMPLAELKERMRRETLIGLSGVDEI